MLERFSILGKEVVDETAVPNEDGNFPVLVPQEKRVGLVRFDKQGLPIFGITRLNLELIEAAKNLPIVRVILDQPPVHRFAEKAGEPTLLTPEGSVQNYLFFSNLEELLKERDCRSCFIADRHTDGRRDHYFATEDSDEFQKYVQDFASRYEFSVSFEEINLGCDPFALLPIEAIGLIGFDVPQAHRMQRVRLNFLSVEKALRHLAFQLEKRGYQTRYLTTLGLAVEKEMSVFPEDFRDELSWVFPMARESACEFLGDETVNGREQFSILNSGPVEYFSQKYLRPLAPEPQRRPPSAASVQNRFGRIFGGRKK
jgi:hypothetical protein